MGDSTVSNCLLVPREQIPPAGTLVRVVRSNGQCNGRLASVDSPQPLGTGGYYVRVRFLDSGSTWGCYADQVEVVVDDDPERVRL